MNDPDPKKANRWKLLPNISYCNFRKEFPTMGDNCFNKWFDFERLWSGKLWFFRVKHHQITLDFRMCFLSDMMYS